MAYMITFILCIALFGIGYMAGSDHGYDKGFEDCKQITQEFIDEITAIKQENDNV